MIDQELLAILACPETRQPLALATDDQVAATNASIADGKAVNVGGEKVTEPIEGGLVREDGKVLYPIRSNIPVLLIEEGLPLATG